MNLASQHLQDTIISNSQQTWLNATKTWKHSQTCLLIPALCFHFPFSGHFILFFSCKMPKGENSNSNNSFKCKEYFYNAQGRIAYVVKSSRWHCITEGRMADKKWSAGESCFRLLVLPQANLCLLGRSSQTWDSAPLIFTGSEPVLCSPVTLSPWLD